jgi:hypothetical protein
MSFWNKLSCYDLLATERRSQNAPIHRRIQRALQEYTCKTRIIINSRCSVKFINDSVKKVGSRWALTPKTSHTCYRIFASQVLMTGGAVPGRAVAAEYALRDGCLGHYIRSANLERAGRHPLSVIQGDCRRDQRRAALAFLHAPASMRSHPPAAAQAGVPYRGSSGRRMDDCSIHELLDRWCHAAWRRGEPADVKPAAPLALLGTLPTKTG